MVNEVSRCHLHPDREAYISCQRCGRPICPSCMREAAVGFQCPTCIKQGAKAVRQPRSIAGGRIAVPGRENVVTLTLIGLNVAIFVLTDIVGVRRVEYLGWMIGDSFLGRDGQSYTGVVDGGYWRLLTSAFLHDGIVHLALNMMALYLFGPFVERALGTWRFVTAYVLSAVFASAVVYLLSDPLTPTVGASGAVFALFGMALFLLLRARQDVRSLLVLLGINAAVSFSGNISWQGHLGGLLAGLALGAAVAYAPRERRTVVQAAAAVALVALTIVIVVLRTVDLTG